MVGKEPFIYCLNLVKMQKCLNKNDGMKLINGEKDFFRGQKSKV